MDLIEIKQIRSRSSDTLYVSLSVAIAGREPYKISKPLGDRGTGSFVPPELVLRNVNVGENEIAVLSYAIVNNGRENESEAIKHLEEAVTTLSKLGAAAAVAAAATSLVGAQIGAAIGSITIIP